MNISEIVHGLGYRFWIKTVSDTGVDDVKHCLEIIYYLQGHLNNIIPASNEESWLKLYDTDDSLMDRDFTDALILSIGFKFWIKTVQLHKIDDLKHCSVTLSYLQEKDGNGIKIVMNDEIQHTVAVIENCPC